MPGHGDCVPTEIAVFRGQSRSAWGAMFTASTEETIRIIVLRLPFNLMNEPAGLPVNAMGIRRRLSYGNLMFKIIT